MRVRQLVTFGLPLFLMGSLVGCGSICNLSGGPGVRNKTVDTAPFGGVVLDAQFLAEPFRDTPYPMSTLGGIAAVVGGVLDFPFSLALDILTLPYTIPVSLSEQ
jgi:uncharacterized protein YceK